MGLAHAHSPKVSLVLKELTWARAEQRRKGQSRDSGKQLGTEQEAGEFPLL